MRNTPLTISEIVKANKDAGQNFLGWAPMVGGDYYRVVHKPHGVVIVESLDRGRVLGRYSFDRKTGLMAKISKG